MLNNLGNKVTMSNNIKRYLKLRGVSAADVCQALGIPKATFSNWVNAVSYPRIDKIEMMARYFGVTKADLVEEQTGYYLDEKAAEMADFLKQNPEYAVLFDASRKVSPEDIEKVVTMINLMSDK